MTEKIMQSPETLISEQTTAQPSAIASFILWFQQAWPRKLEKWKELVLRKLRANGLLGEYDLAFVIYPGNKGWILDAICREIAAHFPGKYCYHYGQSELPVAKAYFLSHHSLYPLCLQANPKLSEAKCLIWYTHPKSLEISTDELIASLNKATKVIATCSRYEKLLYSQGLNQDKATVILGGADPELFQPHQRSNGTIGFCTAYYARKDPDRIFDIVKLMPHRTFILLGKGWDQYERFIELSSFANFTYIESSYKDYPKYYAQMDVFVSASKLEGGPISLIEAMMCNIFPVASDTGFSPDLITHGENGFIFDTDAPIEKVCELIDQAFTMTDIDIRKTVEHLSWKNFSLDVQKLL